MTPRSICLFFVTTNGLIAILFGFLHAADGPELSREDGKPLTEMLQACRAWQRNDLEKSQKHLIDCGAARDDGRLFSWEWCYLTSRLAGYCDTLKVNVSGHLAWSPDGSRLVTFDQRQDAGHRQSKLWNASTGKLLVSTKGAISFSRDNKKLVAIQGKFRSQRSILFDARTGKQLFVIEKYGVWSPDLHYFAAIDSDRKSIEITDCTEQRIQATLKWSGSKVFWSPDSKRLVLPHGDGRTSLVAVYSSEKWEKAYAIEVKHTQNPELLFSSDGSRLRTELGVWDAATGKPIFHLDQESGIRTWWSHDACHVVTRQGKSDLIGWDATTGKRIFTTPGSFLGWSPNGRYLLISPPGYVKTLSVWDVTKWPSKNIFQIFPTMASAASKVLGS